MSKKVFHVRMDETVIEWLTAKGILRRTNASQVAREIIEKEMEREQTEGST